MTVTMWVELAGQLTRIGTAAYTSIRAIVKATDANEAAQLARLDTLYAERIAQAEREATRVEE